MNYCKLDSTSPFTNEFVYIDLPEYLADQLFIKHMVKVKFGIINLFKPCFGSISLKFYVSI